MADFEKAINFVFQNEGGLESNSQDRGGLTNYGITEELLKKYDPGKSVQLLTQLDAQVIYMKAFWVPLQLDLLPQEAATAILDTAVNEGQVPAIKFAQRACGTLEDGLMGPDTINKLCDVDTKDFIYQYVGMVQDRYADLVKNVQGQQIFLKGWLRRSRRLFLLILGE